MNESIAWVQRISPPLDPISQERRVNEIKGQFSSSTGLHQDIANMIGAVGNLCNQLRAGEITWDEFVPQANGTLVPYEQWWHHYTDGISGLSGEEYGKVLANFEDTKVVIAAFDSLIQDVKDVIEWYSKEDMPEKLDEFLNAFYDICDQLELLLGRRTPKGVVVIRDIRDRVEYLLNVS